MLVCTHSYNLRSRSRYASLSITTSHSTSANTEITTTNTATTTNEIGRHNIHSTTSTSSSTSSSASTPCSCIENENSLNSRQRHRQRRNLRRRRNSKYNLRKRTFSEIDTNTNGNNYAHTMKPVRKKSKLMRTVKFNLNDEKICSRLVSIPSSIIDRTALNVSNNRRLESYAIPLIGRRISERRALLICCYSFWNGYRIGIDSTLGSGKDIKEAITILSQELTMSRTKASLQSSKNKFVIWLKNPKSKMIGAGFIHIDSTAGRVNIEMFAVDSSWRGNGFASIMICLIQYRMMFYPKYDLFVCAATSAIPFWLNPKYKFVNAHPAILEEHELADEKNGNTKHLIWYGHPISAKQFLLQCFKQQ